MSGRGASIAHGQNENKLLKCGIPQSIRKVCGMFVTMSMQSFVCIH